jgi:catalase (peroxidase I)
MPATAATAKFVDDFVRAWNKVMTPDRDDVT